MNIRHRKRHANILTWLLSLLILVSLFADIHIDVAAKAEDFADQTVLAFTSDVHNRANNLSAVRTGSWIDAMTSPELYGKIDYMGFCGDMADGTSTVTGSTFWDYVGKVMDVVSEKGIRACYTTGNHEFKNGSFHLQSYNRASEIVKSNYTVDAVPDNVYEEDPFRIYCMGSRAKEDNTFKSNMYLDSQIIALSSYLNSVDNSKVIFVLTHYPLHNYNDREITAADQVIDVLNAASQAGKKIVLLWGHNHTDSDTNYSRVYRPGDIIQYTKAGNVKGIRFYYAAAGCMADAEYSKGSAATTGKGLIVTVDKDNVLHFAYYDKNGKKTLAFTEQGEVETTDSGESTNITTNIQPYKTDPGTQTVIPEAPTEQEMAVAPLNTSLKVFNLDKLQTSVSLKKSTMTIYMGTYTANNCLLEYKKVGADTWKSVWAGKTGKVTLKNIKKNKLYKFRFTTYKYKNKTWQKGKTSAISYRWMNKVTNLTCKSSEKKKVTVGWKKVKDATGYDIQYATDKDFQKGLKKTTAGNKKASKTISGLKKGKTYYVRIRSVKKKGTKKYLGIWTAGKKIKVKY